MTEDLDFINKNLGKALDTIVKAFNSASLNDGKRIQKVNLILAEDALFIMCKDFITEIGKFPYDLIVRVCKDTNNPDIMVLQGTTTKGESLEFQINVKYRDNFLKNLSCYYSIFFLYFHLTDSTLFVEEAEITPSKSKKKQKKTADYLGEVYTQQVLNNYTYLIKQLLYKGFIRRYQLFNVYN